MKWSGQSDSGGAAQVHTCAFTRPNTRARLAEGACTQHCCRRADRKATHTYAHTYTHTYTRTHAHAPEAVVEQAVVVPHATPLQPAPLLQGPVQVEAAPNKQSIAGTNTNNNRGARHTALQNDKASREPKTGVIRYPPPALQPTAKHGERKPSRSKQPPHIQGAYPAGRPSSAV